MDGARVGECNTTGVDKTQKPLLPAADRPSMSAHTRVARVSCSSPAAGPVAAPRPSRRGGCGSTEHRHRLVRPHPPPCRAAAGAQRAGACAAYQPAGERGASCSVRPALFQGHVQDPDRYLSRPLAPSHARQTEPAPASPGSRPSLLASADAATQAVLSAKTGPSTRTATATAPISSPTARSLADRLVAEAQAQADARASERAAALAALRSRERGSQPAVWPGGLVSSRPTAAPPPAPLVPAPPVLAPLPAPSPRAAAASDELAGMVSTAKELGVREDEQRVRMLAAIAAAGQLTHARDVTFSPPAAVVAQPLPVPVAATAAAMPAVIATRPDVAIGPPSSAPVVSAAEAGTAHRAVEAWETAAAAELERLVAVEAERNSEAVAAAIRAEAMTFAELAAAEYNAVVRKDAARAKQTPAAEEMASATESIALPVAASVTPEAAPSPSLAPEPVQHAVTPQDMGTAAPRGAGPSAWRAAARMKQSFSFSAGGVAVLGALLVPVLLLAAALSDEDGDSPAAGLLGMALTFGLGMLVGAVATSSSTASTPPPSDLPSLLASLRESASRLAAAVDGGLQESGARGEARAAVAQLNREAATLSNRPRRSMTWMSHS